MKKMNRLIQIVIILFIAILLVVSIGSVIFYFINVSKQPDNSQLFAYFGSYFGGLVTPILSLISLLIIFNIHRSDNNNALNQINILERQFQTSEYQKRIEDIKKNLDELVEGNVIANDIVDVFNKYKVYEKVISDTNKRNAYLELEKKQQIEYLQKFHWDFGIFIFTLAENINDINILSSIYMNKELKNSNVKIENIKVYLEDLVVFNHKLLLTSHNYSITSYNLKKYYDIVKSLFKCGVISSNSNTYRYFKFFEINKIGIPIYIDFNDFDERNDFLAILLKEKYPEKLTKYYRIADLISKMKVTYNYYKKNYEIKVGLHKYYLSEMEIQNKMRNFS